MNILTGQKNADLLILDILDDKSLINFCLVNKDANRLCSIDSFWINRLVRKYGKESLQFKSTNKTWKQFYLSILKYWDDNVNFAMRKAARGGDKDLVDFFISKGANDWNYGMFYAAQGGHKDLAEFFISKGANNWNRGMIHAAYTGHKDLVDFFISKGANRLDYGMEAAAAGGDKDLVDFFISKGADNWNDGMEAAAEEGHKDLVEFFKQKLKK